MDSGNEKVKVAEYIDLEEVAPYASAIVHHGGIGTGSIALRHGLPQLFIPRVFAQPSNAEWLRKLGVGLILKPHEYTTVQGASAISRLLTEKDFYQNCCRASSAMSDPHVELERVCEFLIGSAR